jgi:MerR family copper efflux transcriptional regulator
MSSQLTQTEAPMRIGELARRAGVSTDTVRFYERQGLLPRPARRENGYRSYTDADAEHLRLLVDLRSLEIPLEQAAEVATMCHAGHCADTWRELPSVIARQREAIAQRIARLQTLERRLAFLDSHLEETRIPAQAVVGACCDAAAAVMTAGEGRCPCCTLVQADGLADQ